MHTPLRPTRITATCLFLLAVLMVCVAQLQLPATMAPVANFALVNASATDSAVQGVASVPTSPSDGDTALGLLAELGSELPELLVQTPLPLRPATLSALREVRPAPALSQPFAERPKRPPRPNAPISRFA